MTAVAAVRPDDRVTLVVRRGAGRGDRGPDPDRRGGTLIAMRALILILLLLFGLPLAAADNPPGPEGKATVAFEMLRTNHMVVRARINGQGPFHLIFDLGAPITLLSTRAGEKSGVIAADAPARFRLGPGEAEIDRLEIGDLTARDVPVIVLDPPVLKELGNALGRRLDGIIGHTFFARYKTTIDYQVRTMTFEPVDFQAGNLLRDSSRAACRPPRSPARSSWLPSGLWGLSLAAPAAGLEVPGVPIRAVLAGSPAAAAGLKPGDVLTTLDGRWTSSITDTYAAAAAAAPDRDVTVVILRDGREQTLTVRPRPGI